MNGSNTKFWTWNRWRKSDNLNVPPLYAFAKLTVRTDCHGNYNDEKCLRPWHWMCQMNTKSLINQQTCFNNGLHFMKNITPMYSFILHCLEQRGSKTQRTNILCHRCVATAHFKVKSHLRDSSFTEKMCDWFCFWIANQCYGRSKGFLVTFEMFAISLCTFHFPWDPPQKHQGHLRIWRHANKILIQTRCRKHDQTSLVQQRNMWQLARLMILEIFMTWARR